MFSYAFARAHAERNGATLCTDRWIGQEIFDLNETAVPVGLPRRDENTIGETEVNCEIRSYCQQQKCLIYTREQVRRWFKLRPEIKAQCEEMAGKIPKHSGEVLAHLRRTDYAGYGYAMPSYDSYLMAVKLAGFPAPEFISDQAPNYAVGFTGDLEPLPDFYRMMTTPVLFRANSSFSWWAATLGLGRVFAPIIDGLEGGKEHNCRFIEGNWPRLHNLDFTTDLHLRES